MPWGVMKEFKMIICLLKYDKYVLSGRPQGATMYYPQDYIAIARDCDLTKDLVFKVGDKATRGFVAIVLSRALDTPLAAADQTGWIIQDGRDGKPLKTLRDELEK